MLLMNRNPVQGSYGVQVVGVPKIKTNPNDRTIGVSQLLVGFYNGDYDGDEFNFKLLEDLKMLELFSVFRPENDILAPLYGKVFGKLTLTKPVNITISSAIEHERELLGEWK